MTQNFKKLAIAAGVSVGMAALSMPSYAVIQGSAGEGLLVPLVVYADHNQLIPGENRYPEYDANTIIQVSLPGSIGFDAVPNDYIAPNTTPTYPGEEGDENYPNPQLLPPTGPDTKTKTIHWYWFDHRSVHRLDKPVKMTANDIAQIDWADAAKSAGNDYNGQAGYMVIGTEDARQGGSAAFTMFGDAWVEMTLGGLPTTLASIPVVPLTDGQDTGEITTLDNIIYKGGIPEEVVPAITGMRLDRNDDIGDQNDEKFDDLVAFDLPLFERQMPAIHVVWFDKNIDKTDVSPILPVDVYDSEEVACSSTAHLPNELNVLWISDVDTAGIPTSYAYPPFFTQRVENFCVPDTSKTDRTSFVTYYLQEYADTGADKPRSAGVAFSLFWRVAGDYPFYTSLQQSMILGHERGTFRR